MQPQPVTDSLFGCIHFRSLKGKCQTECLQLEEKGGVKQKAWLTKL